MNRYLNRYNRLIDHYKQLHLEGYTETHHIVPRCMSGTNDEDNLVKLTAKAHYVAHHLLHKAYPNNRKLALAFGKFVQRTRNRAPILSARMYDEVRKAISIAKKGCSSPLKGKPKSPEHRAKIAAANRAKVQDPEYLATRRAITLRMASDAEWHEKLKIACQKRNSNPEYINKLRGPKSPEHRAKIKELKTHLRRPQIVTCPNCGHSGKHSANIYRYHFKNCRKVIV